MPVGSNRCSVQVRATASASTWSRRAPEAWLLRRTDGDRRSGSVALSVAVKIWVEKLDYRSIEIPTSRKPHHQRKGESDAAFLARRLGQDANRSKRLTFAHRETLKVLADKARHNGLTVAGHVDYRKRGRRQRNPSLPHHCRPGPRRPGEDPRERWPRRAQTRGGER